MEKMKIPLRNLTFALPVRVDSPSRLANLMAVVGFYSAVFDTEFIVLEADGSPKASGVEAFGANVRYRFIEDTNPIFHRTRYINLMYRMARTEYVAVWDVDAVAAPGQIVASCRQLEETGGVMSYPYDGRFWNVGEMFSDAFRKRPDIRILSDFPQSRFLFNGYHCVGGAFIVNADGYRRCGLENENFTGWGPEDAERYKRLEILGFEPGRVDGELYHLDHPRGLNSGYHDPEVALATRKEYCRICSMDRETLRQYISTWKWME